MPEPTSTATTITLGTSAAAVPVLTLFGVPLGLSADVLLAGFAGALAAMTLLDSVPSSGDGIREVFRTSVRRVGVASGSAVTSGYLAPILTAAVSVPVEIKLSAAFILGAGAQRFLRLFLDRTAKKVEASE